MTFMPRLRHTVLQVVPRLDSGGAERTTLEIAGAVVRAGGRALVASAGGRLAGDIERAGGEVINLPVASKNPLVIWRNGLSLASLVGERGVDLIHARSRAPAWSALMAARRTGVPFVTTYHGAYRAAGPLKRRYNSSMLRADLVIANSRFTADRIIADGFKDPQKLRVIPRGADLRVFNPAKISPTRIAALVSKWGLTADEDGFRILLPARLTPWKGHDIAIDAAALVKNAAPSGKAPGLTLVFCGGAQGREGYLKALRARIAARGVRDMVHLVGECADMPAAYAWADAVTSPSTRPEAFGRVAVEAGAMARPVIAANHGGACETVVDGMSGLLAAPGDAEALAAAFQRLMAAPVRERELMGARARARVESLYSADAMCDATLQVYIELLNERRDGAVC